MLHIKFFKYNNTLGVVSDLLILIFTPFVAFYGEILYNISPFSYYSIILILFILAILSGYIKLYIWRKLGLSFPSFIFFSINIIQLVLYIYAISILFNMLYKNKWVPIYLDNLSILSQYRYLFLFLISTFFILAFIIIKILGYNIPHLSFFTYPYLKEEIRKILYTWNDSFIGDCSIKIIDLLYFSSSFRRFFFVMHFILFYLTRLLSTGLLLYCTFYHGDFCNFLYLTPIIFLIWLLSFLNYYFITFQEGSGNYIRSLISATLENKNSAFFGVIKIDPNAAVSFQLTNEAVLKGYTSLDIDHLAKEWYIQAELSSYFSIYFKLINYLNYFILLLQIAIWFYITQIFFFPLLTKHVLGVSIMSLFNFWGKAAVRPYATEARRVLLPYRKELSKVTEGAHKGDHPALVDPAVRNPDNLSEILYEGQPTHGKGSAENPSYPLHSCKDLQGNPRPQNVVFPPRAATYVEEHYFASNPMPGSQSFLNDSEVKANLAKNASQEENT